MVLDGGNLRSYDVGGYGERKPTAAYGLRELRQNDRGRHPALRLLRLDEG